MTFKKGHPNYLTSEIRKKMSEAQKKRFAKEPVWNKGLKGFGKEFGFQKGHKINDNDKSYEWKGEKASYRAKHHWIEKHKGKPKKCEHCGKIGEKIKGRWNVDWANIDHKYRRVLADYIGLCKKCHGKYDKENN